MSSPFFFTYGWLPSLLVRLQEGVQKMIMKKEEGYDDAEEEVLPLPELVGKDCVDLFADIEVDDIRGDALAIEAVTPIHNDDNRL